MAGCAELHEEQCQESEHESLDCPNEQLERNEDDASNPRQEKGEYCQQHAPGKDIAKETEGERDNATQFANNLDQSYDKIDDPKRS